MHFYFFRDKFFLIFQQRNCENFGIFFSTIFFFWGLKFCQILNIKKIGKKKAPIRCLKLDFYFHVGTIKDGHHKRKKNELWESPRTNQYESQYTTIFKKRKDLRPDVFLGG